ncbi:condensation domain-containing protein [Chroococcidiopsis sp.]|uniref:condensation domain-containing protein n=1 Tax=Chroococcidiopsis sp. TaxID=3088168 RepID=UPI003F3294AF
MATLTTKERNLFQSLVRLSTEQRQLFELLLKKQGEDLAQFAIPKRMTSELIPLSYSQEKIWTIAQLTPDSFVDNVPVAFHVSGELNLPVFEKSVNLLIERNEILRTTCTIRVRQPIQTVMTTFKPWVETIDLRNFTREEGLERAANRAKEIAQMPFDLSQDVLFRATVFCLGEQEFIILLVTHQFAIDGLSVRFLLQELATLYKAILVGDRSSLPEPNIQYADFAVWQRQWFSDAIFEPQITYWKKQLSSVPSQLQLPIYQSRQFATLEAGCDKFEFSPTLSDKLRALCRQQGVTSFMAFVALFQIIIHRCTLENEISIGTIISNRNRSEIEKVVGNFANNLLLRTTFSNDLNFGDVLAKVRETILDAYTYQDLPFQRLAESLESLPQFQVLLLLRDSTTAQNLDLPALHVQDFPVDLGVTRMELNLDITDSGKGSIFGKLEYKSALFEASTIKQILKNLQVLLERVTENQNRKIADIVLPETIDCSLYNENLQDKLATAQISSKQCVAPTTEIEKELVTIWAEILGHPEVGIHNNFFELGGHSLLAVKLFAEMEKRFGKNLPLSILFQAPTISQLADVVRRTEETVSWSPLVTIQAGDPKKLPLFCVHGAGFNVLIYRDVALNLGSDQPVYGLQARGLDGNRPVHLDFESIASDYIREVQSVQPEGPYMIGGLSNGGCIAFEMAQQLHAQGQEVILLALFDTYTPDAIALLPPLPRFLSSVNYLRQHMLPPYLLKVRSQPHILLSELQTALGAIRKVLQQSQAGTEVLNREKKRGLFSKVHTQKSSSMFADPEDFSASSFLEQKLAQISKYILQRSSWAFLTPSTQLEEMDDVISTNLKNLEEIYSKGQETYNPQPYSGRITVFKAGETPPGHQVDTQLGWGSIAQAGVEVFEIPGNHTSIMETKLLAEKLRLCIEKAVGN